MRTTLTLLVLLACVAQGQIKKFTFYYNSGKRTPNNYKTFSDSLKVWRAAAESVSVVSVNGYADSKGSAISNLKLSEKRAIKADELMKELNLRYETYKAIGFGEEHPAADNETVQGRSKNRRVEVVLLLKPKPRVIEKDPVVLPPPPQKQVARECNERDTVILLPGGTEIEIEGCSLDGVKLSDIQVSAEEFFEKDKMLQNDMFTQTADGNCLSTGGMLKLRITDKNGNPVKLKPKKDLTIRIPKISADTAFDLYQMKTKDKENAGWEKRNEKVTYKKDVQKFEFKMSQPVISLNLDFLPSPLNKLIKKDPVVKTRVISNGKAYVSGRETVLRLQKVRRRKFKLRNCNCIPLNEQYVTAWAKKGDKIYYCHKKMSELKRRGLINKKYIVRKRDYVVFNDKPALNDQMKQDFVRR